MIKQYNFKNKMIHDYGCYFLAQVQFFEDKERLAREISEEEVQEIYHLAIKKGALGGTCWVINKVKLLKVIAEYFGWKVDVAFIGTFLNGNISYEKGGKSAYEFFKQNKAEQLCIKEYQNKKGTQHFVRVAANGNLIFDSWPGSPIVQNENEKGTRLYWVHLEGKNEEPKDEKRSIA